MRYRVAVALTIFFSVQSIYAFRLNRPSIDSYSGRMYWQRFAAASLQARPLQRAVIVAPPLVVGLIVYQAWRTGLLPYTQPKKPPQEA